MGGLAPIKVEVCADVMRILDSGDYEFQIQKRAVAYYPVATTIIQDIEDNESYVEPTRPERGRRHADVDIQALMARIRDVE